MRAGGSTAILIPSPFPPPVTAPPPAWRVTAVWRTPPPRPHAPSPSSRSPPPTATAPSRSAAPRPPPCLTTASSVRIHLAPVRNMHHAHAHNVQRVDAVREERAEAEVISAQQSVPSAAALTADDSAAQHELLGNDGAGGETTAGAARYQPSRPDSEGRPLPLRTSSVQRCRRC